MAAPHRGSFLVTDPSRPGAPNEDAATCTETTAVLVDGAGVPARYRAGCRHSVAWYARRLADALAARLAVPGTGMREATARAITEVAELHGPNCDLEAGGPSGTVVAVRRRGEDIEHLLLCDSSLLVSTRDGAVRRLTDGRLEALLRQGLRGDEVEALRNRPGGFWVARHEPEAAQHALVGRLPATEVAHLSLVSDGITRALDMFGLETDESLMRACRDDAGARALIGRLREAERRAADEGVHPARKVHDDATVLVPESLLLGPRVARS